MCFIFFPQSTVHLEVVPKLGTFKCSPECNNFIFKCFHLFQIYKWKFYLSLSWMLGYRPQHVHKCTMYILRGYDSWTIGNSCYAKEKKIICIQILYKPYSSKGQSSFLKPGPWGTLWEMPGLVIFISKSKYIFFFGTSNEIRPAYKINDFTCCWSLVNKIVAVTITRKTLARCNFYKSH